jgi:RNA-directed DNA polymerase
VVRYADDFVVLHPDRTVIEQCQVLASDWLKPIGLELKPSKTRIAHTLEKVDGLVGFDFLGFNIRQYKVGRTKSGKSSQGLPRGFKTLIKPSKKAVGRHLDSLRSIVNSHKTARQEHLIYALNRSIIGWTHHFSTVVSLKTFASIVHVLFLRLWAWAKRRHPNKGQRWCAKRYWRRDGHGAKLFQPPAGQPRLHQHDRTPIRRHVKVKGSRSPFDGDWLYWSTRQGRSPVISPRVARLLKKQLGRCIECGLFFRDGELLDLSGRSLLHRHCPESIEAESIPPQRTFDNGHEVEEPYDGTLSRTVL